MTLAPDGRISHMDTFVLPKQFTASGHPATLDPATELSVDDHTRPVIEAAERGLLG
jgi:hypothetical protein